MESPQTNNHEEFSISQNASITTGMTALAEAIAAYFHITNSRTEEFMTTFIGTLPKYMGAAFQLQNQAE